MSLPNQLQLTAAIPVDQGSHDESGTVLRHHTLQIVHPHSCPKQARDLVHQHGRRGLRTSSPHDGRKQFFIFHSFSALLSAKIVHLISLLINYIAPRPVCQDFLSIKTIFSQKNRKHGQKSVMVIIVIYETPSKGQISISKHGARSSQKAACAPEKSVFAKSRADAKKALRQP